MTTATEDLGSVDLEPLVSQRVADVRVADVLVDVLSKAGVRAIFGIPGGAIAPINDALLDRPEIRTVTSRHESGAVFAACGHARATERIGVVTVTSGPGVLNTMTGLASAQCDGIPLLVLAGEVPRTAFGRGALQEGSANHLNIINMAKHVTKFAVEVTSPDVAPAMLQRAITTANSGRKGPVLVTLPLDVTAAMINRPIISADVQTSAPIDQLLIEKVAGILESARRAVIFAGSGTRWGQGAARLLELSEKLQIPVMTTPKAKGVFPESHPLSLGVFGHGGHPSTAKYLGRGIDVVLAVGTSLGDPATDGWSSLLNPTEHFIQIDAEALYVGRNYAVSVGLIGTAENVLERIRTSVRTRPPSTRRFGVRKHSDPRLVSQEADRPISPPRALWEVQQILPKDTLFTCDIGEHLLFATHYLEINDPQGFGIMTGLASMGSSIGSALGTKLAKPERPVAAICGDGCFAMALGDLGTAVREKLPLVVVVLNDRRYGMVELGHAAIYGRSPDYSCTELRIEELARGVGADVVVAERPGDLLALDVTNLSRPLVIEVRIDPNVRMPTSKRTRDLGKASQREVPTMMPPSGRK